MTASLSDVATPVIKIHARLTRRAPGTSVVVFGNVMRVSSDADLGASRRRGSGLDARRAAFHRGLSLAGNFDRIFRPILCRVRPERLTSNDDPHVPWLGGVLAHELGVPLNICVLMAQRAWHAGRGEVDSDVFPRHRIAGVVHHEDVDRVLTAAGSIPTSMSTSQWRSTRGESAWAINRSSPIRAAIEP